MNIIHLKKIFFLPLLFVMLLVSCQDEVTEITNPNEEETIVANSPLASLMRNTAANDGSTDNIIDFANCLEIELPVTVIVDGVEIIIDSETDFEDIEDIFDEFDDDIDDLEIVFPITIIFSDYTTLIIENEDALETLIDACNDEDEDDDDIECIDFQYPITISVYNTDFQVVDTITINDDEALYHFIENIEGGVLASINFPVTMVLANGETLVVLNNTELEAAIEAADDDCDEDDDYDWNDDDDDDDNCNEEDIADTLIECQWYYTTSLYSSFVAEQFLFLTDGTVEVYNVPTSDLVTTGTWLVSSDGDGVYLALDFGTEPYAMLTLSWELVACDDDSFEFVHGDDILAIEQDCEEDSIVDCNVNLAGLEALLLECNIEAYTYDASGNIIDENYLNFNVNGEVVVNGEPTVTEVGSWSLLESGSGYVLTIDGLVTFDLLNGEWLLLGCEEEDFIFQQGTGNDAITMELEQNCSNSSGTVEDLEGTVIEGQWVVANYNDSGVDETNDYTDYVFDFNTNGTVNTTNGTDTISGTWSAIIDSGQLKLVLDFGTVIPFDEFNDDWDVINLVANRIELRDVSGSTGETDILVFEKF